MSKFYAIIVILRFSLRILKKRSRKMKDKIVMWLGWLVAGCEAVIAFLNPFQF